MRQLLTSILYHLAKGVLRTQRPDIVAVTGSVGKTSTKNAITTVLSQGFKVRSTHGNQNNELGVPLTILGAVSPGRNVLGWLWVICKGVLYSIFRLPFPSILVIEMGIDKPGDMAYLTKLAKPYVSVVTAISDHPSHVEQFKDTHALAREKYSIYTPLEDGDWAIYNADEQHTATQVKKPHDNNVSIGINSPADIQAVEIEYAFDPRTDMEERTVGGLRFKLRSNGNTVPVFIPGAYGTPAVYATLIAAAVGQVYGVNLVQVSEAMRTYASAKGRMNIVAGMRNTTIIDDTYNSSPIAVRAALEVLQNIGATTRRIVCLGNMEELGKASKRAHTLIGKKIANSEIDILYTLGDKANGIAVAAVGNGMPEAGVHHFANHQEMIDQLRASLQPHDVVLVKGSQSARMEKIVKGILDNPDQATTHLVRQYGKWLTS